MRAKNGFTLLELLVVIGIMVILMSIAAAGYLGIRRGAEIRGGVMTLRTTLMLARQEAVTKRRNVTVEFLKGASLVDPDTLIIISSSAGITLTNNVIHLPLGIQFDDTTTLTPIPFKPSGCVAGLGYQTIGLIEKPGMVADAARVQSKRSVKVWFLTGITKEQ